jgi:uncharacterized protein YhbP (UPF0306 family)
MAIEELIRQGLNQGKVMQLATVSEGQPWICTVHYVPDENMNVYWLSLPTRRHSQEIAKNNKVAITVPVKFDQPVIGIQIEGAAAEVNNKDEIAKIMKLYIEKYHIGQKFYDNFVAGNNQHHMYKFTPSNFVLFDEVNFPGNGRQEWQPGQKSGE